MVSKPLKIHLSRQATIPEPSVVNYDKVYLVETNVKVKDVGELDSDSKDLLLQYLRRFYGDIIEKDAKLSPPPA